MRELIGRLEVVDDNAASALRVIAHFDSLVEARVSVPALLRAAAALAGCGVGLHEAASGTTRVVDAKGVDVAFTAAVPAIRHPVDPARGSSVWLARTNDPGPMDELILERLTRALQARPGGRSTADGVEVAVRLACDADLTVTERAAALRTLGLRGRVTVIALDQSARLAARRSAVIDDWRILLVADGEIEPTVPTDQVAGTAVVDANDLPLGWQRAMLARRLGVALGPVGSSASYESLGPLAGLTQQLPADLVSSMPEVIAFTALAADHPWVPATVYAIVGCPSARQAAAELRVHHSTLQERVAWLEQRLGFSVREPEGRHRASLTVALWRIAAADTR